MKLQAFIHKNFDLIVEESQASARALLPALKTLPDTALRRLTRDLLDATLTGVPRHEVECDLDQVLGAFQTMRSRVLTLWRDSGDIGDATAVLDQVDSFNKAADDALRESVEYCVSTVSASRDMFLAVLAHDLRSPLQAIAMANKVLVSPALPEAMRIQAATRAIRATDIVSSLLTDFLDFTRGRLGVGIPVHRSMCDLRPACEEALEVIKANEPNRKFVQQISGNMRLYADYPRLRQVLSNLLNNAVQHGDQDTPILLTASGEQDAVTLAVANSGRPISPEAARVIFEPLVQVPATTFDLNKRPRTSLGLGLFIAREIVRSHQGTISVQSSDGQTVFTVRLPRMESASSLM